MTKAKTKLSVDKHYHKVGKEKKTKMFGLSIHSPSKETNSLPSSKLDEKILKLKKMLSARSVPEQYQALKVLGNAMKRSNAVPSGKRHTTMSHLMRADIFSFIYAGFNIDNPDLAKPRFECVRQLIASTCLTQQNNASATLDFLLRWINHADSMTGKGLSRALTLLARMVERLSAPTHEFRRLVGVSAVGRTLDAICAIAQKPQGQGGWQVQLCAGSALAALLSPHALGIAPDAPLVQAVGDVYGACLVQLSAAVRTKAATGAAGSDDAVGHRAVATMAQMGHAAIALHGVMTKRKGDSLGTPTSSAKDAMALYCETILTVTLENFVLVCAPFVAIANVLHYALQKAMIDEDKLPMYESFLKCLIALLSCPALASSNAPLAFKLATTGHLQLLALLSGFQVDKPLHIHSVVNSGLAALLSALAKEAFETDALRERITEGALHLPPCPVLWFQYLARPHASDAFTHAVLTYAYFHCLLHDGAESCYPALFPSLVAMLNMRFSPERCVGVSPLLTKLIWFTFAASRPSKGGDSPESARATDALISLLEQVSLSAAFTPHPALLRCACWTRVPSDLRAQIILQWLLVDGDADDGEDFETLELASALVHPLAAGTMLSVITVVLEPQAVKRGLDAMALAILRWPNGALARTLAANLALLLDKMLTPRCTLSATDCATLVALATGPLSQQREPNLKLAAASSLSALVARTTYAVAVPPTLYSAELCLALVTLPNCVGALPALTTRTEMIDAVERAAQSVHTPLREAAYRLLVHVATADKQTVPQWEVSVSGEHALAALASSVPTLVLATLQLFYVLLPVEPRSDCAVTLVRSPSFLGNLAGRSAIICFKFQKSDRKICDGAWQLFGRVAQVALREGGTQKDDVASALWLEVALKHCRLSRHVLQFIEHWVLLFRLPTGMRVSEQTFNWRWEALAAAVDRLLAERFAKKLKPVAVKTMQGILENQPGLDSHRAEQLRKRIDELRNKTC